MHAAGTALVYLVIIVLELNPLIKSKEKAKVMAYSVLMTISLILGILLSLDVKILSPAFAIEKIVFTIIKK